MKIVLAFPGCHRRGGVERVMVECANFLNARGHEVSVYASDWDENVLDAGIKRQNIAVSVKQPLRLLSYNRAALKAVRQTIPPPDVTGAFGILAATDAVAWVQAVHGAWMEVSRQQRDWKGRLKQRLNLYHPLVLAFERRVYGGRRYRKLIALGEQVKTDLIRFYSVPAEDIVIIPNGFAPREFNVARTVCEREAMRERLGYGPETKVVVFVANELERKGFGPLLRALASLKDDRVHLLAVGRLSANAYAAEIADLGMSSHVQFTGPSSDVASFYAASDVFALPTQYEAWGLVITEAMACGLPVLTSRLAGAAIAVQKGVTGALLDDPNSPVEIAAKIRPLLDGQHAAPEEIANSVSAYAWPEVLRRYESLLVECATASPARKEGHA